MNFFDFSKKCRKKNRRKFEKFKNFDFFDIFRKIKTFQKFSEFFFREKNTDIENRLHKPLNNAYGQLRNQKKLGLA